MCGRFTVTVDRVEFILERFKAQLAPGYDGYKPGYNVAPGQFVPAIVAKEQRRYLTSMLWGIVPPWGEAKTNGGHDARFTQQINVRDDTVVKNAFFRNRLLNNRCIFVTDGFYEWQSPEGYRDLPRGKRLPKGVHKTPHRISVYNPAEDPRNAHNLFALAGLWRTIEMNGKPIVTAAIITTSPNEFMKEIHNRMPVILEDQQLTQWLDPSYKEFDALHSVLAPYAGTLRAYPVSPAVNANSYDDPRCIEPLDTADSRITK